MADILQTIERYRALGIDQQITIPEIAVVVRKIENVRHVSQIERLKQIQRYGKR